VSDTAGNQNSDMPQLALGRYVQLLRRRWWQVVPVSILGLVIGALIAQLVPRYYVTFTQVQYQGSPFANEGATLRDPMAGEMRIAESTIQSPILIESVLDKLGWSEFKAADEEGRRGLVSEALEAVVVRDVIDGETRDRTFLKIHIEYRNLDAQRAVDFTNELRNQWIRSRLDELEAQGSREIDSVQLRRTAVADTRDELRLRIAQFEAEHELNPEKTQYGQNAYLRLESEEAFVLQEKVRELEVEVEKLRIERDGIERRLANDRIPREIPADVAKERAAAEQAMSPAQRALVDQLTRQFLQLQLEISSMTDANPYKATRVRALEDLVVRAKTAGIDLGLPAADPAAPGGAAPERKFVPNPEYDLAQERVVALNGEIAFYEGQLAELEAELTAAQQRLEELPQIWAEYGALKADLEQQSENVTALMAELNEMLQKFSAIQNREVLQTTAWPFAPKAPTEPSPILLAAVGSLLGLGVAVGLILAWDFLQATFKSVDDVARGLPLPVLGTMAHVETIEERLAAANSRWRVSVAASVLLVLTLSVVTLYYVAPARLPQVVLEIFDLILGNAR
jgi:uncharacterized protein involved in exopolysaccharide biosynthesis